MAKEGRELFRKNPYGKRKTGVVSDSSLQRAVAA